jgi:predicted TIM-barrel fold metal-dependent hydrolase
MAVAGIDVHVHVHTGEKAQKEELGAQERSLQGYFRTAQGWPTGDQVAERYAELNLMAVIFDVDTETRTGVRISNADIAAWVRRHAETLIGFGSVDPWKGRLAIDETRRCVEELGLRGMKFEPASQGFAPNDTRFYPLWETCSRLGVPALFHSGMAGTGAGTPGGGGVRLGNCEPLLLDDVAADFPELTIISAHPGWPWQEEQLAMARHKANVYLDLSGWAPRYWPASLIQYANTLLQDKVLFGTDHPLIPVDRWLKEFAELPFKAEVRPKIMRENARRLLRIPGPV